METVIKFWRKMEKAINWICEFSHFLGEIGTFLLMSIIFYAVAMRYVFNHAPTWSEEICVYILIGVIWISIAGVLKNDHHIALDLIIANISPRKQNWFKIIIYVIGFSFCVVLFWYSIKYTLFQYRFQFKSNTLLEIPLWMPYLLIPAGLILICLQYVVKIVGCVSNLLPDNGSIKRRGV